MARPASASAVATRTLGGTARPAPVRPRSSSVTPAAAALAVAAAFLLLGTLLWEPPLILLWNASASSPIGLYAVGHGDLRIGSIAVAWPPPGARWLAARRHYLPASVPLVKRVAAISGNRVCALGRIVSVDGRPVAVRQPRDPSGRRLPWWFGCRALRRGELFLLSAAGPTAFDGRYFGITAPGQIVGKATLLWANPASRAKHG